MEKGRNWTERKVRSEISVNEINDKADDVAQLPGKHCLINEVVEAQRQQRGGNKRGRACNYTKRSLEIVRKVIQLPLRGKLQFRRR